MRLLLDTHAFLWWMSRNTRLSPRARAAISAANAETFVSAISAWEIATKVRIGKLPGAERIAENPVAAIASQNFESLPISVAHAQRAGALAGRHKVPGDRMLIAQALIEDLDLVSNERRFDSFGVRRLW
jgi:PIN domain nuclease of toxin-antitoxin system